MEEKMRRESKVYVEKLFKNYDKIGAGAIHKDDMAKLINTVIPDFLENVELESLLLKHAKRNKHTIINPKTKQIEYQYHDDTIDFPSCMAIAVHFLTKIERKQSDAFAGQGLIRFSDVDRRPSMLVMDPNQMSKKRLF